MSLKRELEDDFSERVVKAAKHEEETIKKHSLDSDEEDSDEERKKHYEILDDDDIEGKYVYFFSTISQNTFNVIRLGFLRYDSYSVCILKSFFYFFVFF